MVYVSGGKVLDSRSPWRLAFIPELFWSFVNFIVLFFQTLINPNKSKYGNTYTTDYRSSGGGPDGPPAPRRRMGGFRGGAGAPSPPPMGGGG